MANTTGHRFIDTLDFLFIECLTSGPYDAIACRMNAALGVISSLILPIFILAGFFGNTMTAYIYLWKLRPLTRHGVYFAVIGISDNCSLFINGFMWMFLAKGLPWISGARIGYFIMNSSDAACRVYRFLESLFNITSSSLFLVMVIDRCLSVYFPFRFQQVSAKTAVKACALVIVIDLLIAVMFSVAFHWVYIRNIIVCVTSLSGWQKGFHVIVGLSFINPSTLIFVVILGANGFPIHKMRQIASEQAEIRAGQRDDSILTNTIICVVLSCILIVSSIPVVSFSVGDYALQAAGMPIEWSLQKILWACNDIGRILILFNQSINWIFLTLRSAQFRQSLMSSCGIGSNPSGSESQTRHRAEFSTDRITVDNSIQLRCT